MKYWDCSKKKAKLRDFLVDCTGKKWQAYIYKMLQNKDAAFAGSENMDKKAKKVYVIGHKNPDTDSICSAIAYANLKLEIT